MAKVLVTGGAGFIGSNLSNHFAKAGYEVVAFDNLYLGKTDNLIDEVKFVEGDINSVEDLDKLDGDFDYVVHLAAASSAPMFETDFIKSVETNQTATFKIFEWARKTGVKKIAFASTSSIYGDNPPPLKEDMAVTPPNIYSVTKHNMEEMARIYADLYDMEIIAFRFMSIYGPNEIHKGKFANLVSQFLWTMYQGKAPVIFGDGSQTRDFTSVHDVVQAIRKGIETDKKYTFTIFNIGSEKNYTVTDLVKKINQALGTNIEPKYIVSPLKWTAKDQLGDLSKIEKELGYKSAVTLDEGLKELVADLPDNPADLPDVSDVGNTLLKK